MKTNLEANAKNRIGCHCWGTSPDSIGLLADEAAVGVRWVRATRQMQLEELLPNGPGKYDFARAGEHSIDLAIAKGMSIMGILDGRWGNETFANKLEWCSPIWKHLDVWCDFVAAVANHYKDRVKYWEVINEPPFFWWYPPAPGAAFPEANAPMKRATVGAYAELLKATAKTVRACDPEAKIVVGSGFRDGSFLRRLYEHGCREYFDVACVHYLPCHHPDAFATSYLAQRNAMAEYGDEKKPLWDTENGPHGAFIGIGVDTPEGYQGLYHVYRHCFAHQFGLERYFWFNPPGGSHGVGIREKNGEYSAAYRSMAVMTEQLGDGDLLGHERVKEDVHIYVFEGTRGPVSVAWATAPATMRLAGGGKAVDYLGKAESLPENFALTAKPIYVEGDLRKRDFSVEVTGPCHAVLPGRAEVQPKADSPTFVSHRVAKPLALDDARWKEIPVFAKREEIAVGRVPEFHFAKVPAPLPAELKMAHDAENLYLQARIWDERLEVKNPSGVVQFVLRDSNPAVKEWPFFIGGYGLFGLDVAKGKGRFLLFEHVYPSEYAHGVVPGVPVAARVEEGALVVTAAIPWSAMGSLRPGKDGPFFATFSITRRDELLEIPDGNDPAEWSNNYADVFIVLPHSLQGWVKFE